MSYQNFGANINAGGAFNQNIPIYINNATPPPPPHVHHPHHHQQQPNPFLRNHRITKYQIFIVPCNNRVRVHTIEEYEPLPPAPHAAVAPQLLLALAPAPAPAPTPVPVPVSVPAAAAAAALAPAPAPAGFLKRRMTPHPLSSLFHFQNYRQQQQQQWFHGTSSHHFFDNDYDNSETASLFGDNGVPSMHTPINVRFPEPAHSDEEVTSRPLRITHGKGKGKANVKGKGKDRGNAQKRAKYGPYQCKTCSSVFGRCQEYAAHMAAHYRNSESEQQKKTRRESKYKKRDVHTFMNTKDGITLVPQTFQLTEDMVEINRRRPGGDGVLCDVVVKQEPF